MRYLLIALLLTGCATPYEIMEQRQSSMRECIDHYSERGVYIKDSYEMCRRIYGSNRVQCTKFSGVQDEAE